MSAYQSPNISQLDILRHQALANLTGENQTPPKFKSCQKYECTVTINIGVYQKTTKGNEWGCKWDETATVDPDCSEWTCNRKCDA